MKTADQSEATWGELALSNMAAGVNNGMSWASLFGENISNRDSKNVMDIVLEKDERGAFNASDVEVARVLQKLGADLRPGVHIEGVQICPMGKNVIQVTLNKNVNIERFCNKDVLEIKQGVRISHISPEKGKLCSPSGDSTQTHWTKPFSSICFVLERWRRRRLSWTPSKRDLYWGYRMEPGNTQLS